MIIDESGSKLNKIMATVQLIELTVVVAIETYVEGSDVSAMDYVTVASEAQIIGWHERELGITAKENQVAWVVTPIIGEE